jgi:hypothetical protein
MATHRVYYRKGEQSLRTIPHRDGRPVRVTAATYAIYNARHTDSSTDYITVAPGTAAILDAVSTTLSANAGRRSTDRRTLTVVSTVGIAAGRTYLLTSPSGVVELVRIAAVVSATALLAGAEIRGDFGTGSTLKGVELTATFPAAQADDEDNLDDLPWIVVWAIDGFAPLRESVHLERGEEALLATLDDLRELDPMLSTVGGDRIDPALALARAHRDLRTDLQLAGASESDMLLGPIGRDAVCYRAAYLCTHHDDSESGLKRAQFYLDRYNELRTALQVGHKRPEVVAVDKADGSASSKNPARLFVRYGM